MNGESLGDNKSSMAPENELHGSSKEGHSPPPACSPEASSDKENRHHNNHDSHSRQPPPSNTRGGGKSELARQVNRFSSEELQYLEQKFAETPTPNLALREEIALALSKRRMQNDYECMKGGATITRLTQVQIKYWFDHQRRKRKRLKLNQDAAARKMQAIAEHAYNGKNQLPVAAHYLQGHPLAYQHPGVSMSPVPQYDPSSSQYHFQAKTPTGVTATCDVAGLQRTSPTGVLPSPVPLSFGPYQASAAGQQPPLTSQQSSVGGAASMQMQIPASVPAAPVAMPLPLPLPRSQGGGSPPLPSQSGHGWDMNHYIKYWQALSVLTKSSQGPVGGPALLQQQFKVEQYAQNDVIVKRFEGLTKALFVLSGTLRVSYYAKREDEMPHFCALVSQESFIGKADPTICSAGGLMIQAQTPCYLAAVDVEQGQEMNKIKAEQQEQH